MPDFSEEKDLANFGFWCKHQGEFKVAIPATVSKFKLMLWFQHEERGRKTEELLGFSDPFDLMLPDDVELMGVDEVTRKD